MKNLNLIERLLSYSHEKQSPQRFVRYAAMLIMLLTLGVGQMWAYDAHFSLMGDPLNNSWANDRKFMINTGTGTTDEWYIYAYVAKNQYFALNNGSDQYGPGTNGKEIKNGSGGGTGNYNTYSWKFTGTSGIVKICCAESSNREWYPYVWVEESAPTIKFKHPWNGGSWTEQTATKQGNGTYRYKGQYGGTAGFNAGYSSNFKYNASATTVTGSPASGDYCYFIWNPVGYVRGTQDYDNGNSQNVCTGTFTIVKLCNITYQGNGKTGGTVPSAQNDNPSGTAVTLSNGGNLAKTGYTLTGWNTASDGSGTHYDLSGSFTPSTETSLTLYAEWTQTITVDVNTGTSAGSMSIFFNATELKSFTAATKTNWVLDSYWTSSDNSGSKVINYDGTNATLVSGVTNYTDNTGKWTRAAATTLYAHWKQTYRVYYNANYPAGATSTSGSVPTDATEYSNGATVTVKTNSGSLAAGGFTFAGWNTNEYGTGTDRAPSSTFSISGNTTLYAKWTENMTTVNLVASPAGGGTFTVGGAAATSTTAGVTTTRSVAAVPYPGYRTSATLWTKNNSNISWSSNSTNPTTITGGGTAGTSTNLTGNFTQTYAYLQGRMTIRGTLGGTKKHIASSEGGWDKSSNRIKMDYDGTNHRFYLHTYMTPSELSAQQSSQYQWFSFKTSTNSSTLTSPQAFEPASNQEMTTTGSANKKTVSAASTDKHVRFNSSVTNGYAILYFDESGVWYELEHSLTYDKNGGSGTPTATACYNNGTNATAADGTGISKSQYTFSGWNTNQYITGTSYAAGASVPMSANTTLYAKWTRSITLNANGGGSGSTSVTATYNCATLPSITNPSKTGYDFGGWYTANDGSGSQVINTSGALQASVSNWTDGSSRFTRTTSVATLYAKWTQTITLNANTSYHGSGDNTSATVILNKTALSTITHCTPATGYQRTGYYTDATGGTKVLNADGSFAGSSVTDYITSSKWIKAGATTLYAHYDPTVYTISFNADDASRVGTATNVQSDVTVTFNAKDFSVAKVKKPILTGYTFGGYYTAVDGGGVQIVDENGDWQSSKTNYLDASGNWIKAANTTLYAKWTANTCTVSFYAGLGSVSPTSSTVTMGATYGEGTGLVGGELPTPTPYEGYVFVGWFTSYEGGSEVTNTTQVTTAIDHTIYAHYTQKLRVYFKNTLGWDSVFVTYGAYWDSGEPSKGSGNKDKIYHKMTRQGTSDIWYDDIPDACLVSWEDRIAFNSQRLGNVGSSSNYDNFNKGQAVFRRDFDRGARMFVPTPNDPNKFTLNKIGGEGTTYYSTDQADGDPGRYKNGYWVTSDYNMKAGYTLKGSWDSWAKDNHIVSTTVFPDSVYVHTIRGLAASTTYQFKLWKLCSSNETGSVFSSTTAITSSTADDAAIFNAKDGGSNASMTTTVAGDYVFKFNFSKDGKVKLTIEYPYKANDYRVLYSWNDGSAKERASETIHPKASSERTISMFVHKSDVCTPHSLKIQKYNGSTWGDVTGGGITISGVEESGVYNFIITQPASGDPTGALSEKYEGNYYIRTDSAAGGWDQYKVYSSSKMTLSEYSMTQTLSDPYSHYYCLYVGDYGADISYAIATEHSPNISGTMIDDDVIGTGKKRLPSGHPASVRFSWNEQTNAMRRAYLKSAQGDGNKRFLVLHGSDTKVLDKDGNTIAGEGAGPEQIHANELLFSDAGNWVYEVKLQAQPGAKVSLIARYNSIDRYLIGGAETHETILGGKGTGKYEISAVYDFKTNRLMTAWTPGGAINDTLSDVDLMILRERDEHGTAITFGAKGSLEAKKVIGALQFNYDDLVGHVTTWTPAARVLLKYFISFPFDVNVSDIFGLNSKYGDAYVVMKYNGAKRAKDGFFLGDGTETFWEDLTLDSVMHANEGYCVVLDNDKFNYSFEDIWNNKSAGSSVYLYFPSATNVGNIASGTKTITVPSHQCNINRTFTDSESGKKLNHKYTDSHWNMMGVPIFNDHIGDDEAEGTPGAIFTETVVDTTKAIAYFYAWDKDDNKFHIQAADGYQFKVMHSYMVQYTGDVKFTGSAPVPASVAARRMPSADENYQIEVQVLNNDDNVLNRTYVELRENACDTFALNEDVYMAPDGRAASIFTYAGNYDVAANVLSINSHIVPMGVCVRKADTYTFSMPSNFSGTVTLVDTYTQTRTNLALDNYTVNMPKGTNTDRFLLEININKVPTAIDGAKAGEGTLKDGKVHKFIMNDQMYILKNGVLYDARGNRVK